ncbi:MAG TPA: glycosyltransferase family 39 protein [Rudaea sp.]|jgi:4-amino-4-deoxy-L-arabinose transferase-like glycosyltransferase
MSSAATRDRRAFWLFLLLAVLVLGAGIGMRDPWPADEPRFALVAKQMVESGDWLIPHRGSELYADKPPLFMDLQASAFELTGNWRVAFLLPSLLAALGTLLLVYDLGRRLWNRRVGRLAAWLVLFAIGFTFQAKRAQIDPTVTFLIVLAVYGFLRHLLLGPDWRWWALGGLAAGLGVVTKGVGVLAFFVLLPWVWLRWRARRGVSAADTNSTVRGGWRWALAPALCLIAIAAWLLPLLWVVHAQQDPAYTAYLDNLLFKQTAERYAAAWHHQQPVWYYLEVIALQWLPLSLFLPWLIPAWWRRLRRGDPRYTLLLGFVFLIVLFFSLSAGKREVYILPALPLLALAAAPLLTALLARWPWSGRLLWGLCAAFATAALIAGIYAWRVAPDWGLRQLDSRDIDRAANVIWIWLTAIGACGLIACAITGPRRSLRAATATLAVFWICVGVGIMPALNDSSSARGLMRAVGARIGMSGELGLVAWKEQNLLMADRPATDFGFSKPWREQLSAAIRWQAAVPAQRWILLPDSALDPCVARERAVDVGESNRSHWWLFRADAVANICRN